MIKLHSSSDSYQSIIQGRYRRSDSESDSDDSQKQLEKIKGKAQLSKDMKLLSVMLNTDLTQEQRIEEIKKTLDNGANINIQFISIEKNRTPLHLAVRRREVKVVKFLLERGANPEIKDQDNKTPIALVSKKRGNDGSFKSREVAEIYELLSKSAGIFQLAVVPDILPGGSGAILPEKSVPSVSIDEPISYSAAGLKPIIHGSAYQLQLLILFMKRGIDRNYEFLLATEMTAAEKFDDLVFRYQEQGQQRHLFLQAKHRQDEGQRISSKDLLNNAGGDFSIAKYFSSYLKIQDKNEFKNSRKDFFLCTNIDLDLNELSMNGNFLITELTTPDDFLTIKNTEKSSKRYRLEINRSKYFYQELLNNPETYQLAEVLLERLKNGKMDLKSDILKRYHKGVASEVINIKEKKFYKNFIEGNNLAIAAQKFREIFIQVALRNPLYENNEIKLWDALKDKKFSLSGSFGLGEGDLNLPTSLPVDAAVVEDFFSHFTLAVNQPNEVQLRNILASEIGDKIQFQLLENDFLADYIQRRMWDWFKAKDGVFFSTNQAKSYFSDALKKMDTLLFTGYTVGFFETLEKNYDIHFNEASIPQFNLLLGSNRILHLVASENKNLETVRIYQLLKKNSEYKAKDSILFVPLGIFSKEEIRNRLLNTFNSKISHLLLVIECADENIELRPVVDGLVRTLQAQKNKKIILIAPDTHPLVIALKTEFVFAYNKIINPVSFNDLTVDTQTTLLEKIVFFQGKEVALKKLIHNSDPIIQLLPLERLIQGRTLYIAHPLLTVTSKEKPYYIERRLSPTLIKSTLLQAETTNGFTDLIVYDGSKFQKLCQENPEETIHWLQKTDSGMLVWHQSQGNLASLLPHLASPYESIIGSTEVVENVIKLSTDQQGKVIILSAEAGMGKTTFFTHTAQQLKEQSPGSWVIRVDLTDQVDALEEVRKAPNFLEAVKKWLAGSLSLSHSFEVELLYQALDAPALKVILLMDGFDEISKLHREVIIDLVKQLQQLKATRVWISTRPNLVWELAKACNQLPFSLVPLTPSDQVEFLTHYCNKKLAFHNKQNLMKKGFFDQWTQLTTQSPSLHEIIRNPLHLQMLAEVLSSRLIESDPSHLIELKDFDKLALYQEFIKTKYTIFVNRDGEARNQQVRALLQSIAPQAIHLKLALEILFPSWSFLLEEFSLQDIPLLDPEELARYGIVKFEDGKPQFIHRSYAEYYIAEEFGKVILKKSSAEKIKDFLLCEIFAKEVYQGVNSFLEFQFKKIGKSIDAEVYRSYGQRLKDLYTNEKPSYLSRQQLAWLETGSRHFSHTLLTPSVKDGYQHILQFLLKSLIDVEEISILRRVFLTQDQERNTLFHIAVKREDIGIVRTLLVGVGKLQEDHILSILTKQNRQKQSILHLGVEEGYVSITSQLLEWGKWKFSSQNFRKFLLQEDAHKQTALRIAIIEDHPQMTKNLLEWYKQIDTGVEKVAIELLVTPNAHKMTCYRIITQADSLSSRHSFEIALRWVVSNIDVLDVTNGIPSRALMMALARLYETNDLLKGETQRAPLLELLATSVPDLPELHKAVLQNDIVTLNQLLQNRDAEALLIQDSVFRLTPLHLAILRGEEPIVWRILMYGKESLSGRFLELLTTTSDRFGQTVFHLAALNNLKKTTEWLLEQAVTVGGPMGTQILLEAKNKFGQTALHMAIISVNPDMVEKLLKVAKESSRHLLEKQLSTPDGYARTPLQQAIEHHGRHMVELILAYGEALESSELDALLLHKNSHGNTPLHIAVRMDVLEISNDLVFSSYEKKILNRVLLSKNQGGNTPLQLAIFLHKEAMVENILKYAGSLIAEVTKQMLLSQNKEGNTPLHMAIKNKKSKNEILKNEIIQEILKQLNKLEKSAVTEILLIKNRQGDTPLRQVARIDSSLPSMLVKTLDSLTPEITEMLLSTVNHANREAVPKHAEQHSKRLTGFKKVLRQSQLLDLKPAPCSSGSMRIKRTVTACMKEKSHTGKQFYYQPIQESVPVNLIQASHEYLHVALALSYRDKESFSENINKLLEYQHAMGVLLSEGGENHSPRETAILNNHYQSAQQFVDRFSPKNFLFYEVTEALTDPISSERRSWWLDSGHYSLSILWDGSRYALYSPDLNYHYFLHAKLGTTLSQIEAFARAFFEWRCRECSIYAIRTLKRKIPEEVKLEIRRAPFWQPENVISDSVLLTQSGSQIAGVPLAALEALLRINGRPVAHEALHADFLSLHKKDIRLHVESLHQVLATLSEDERRNLKNMVYQNDWSADSGALHDHPEPQEISLIEYRRLVMEEFKKKDMPLVPERLSKLSWHALKYELGHYLSEVPNEIKESVIDGLWSEIKPKIKRARFMGKRFDYGSLFYLPDLIYCMNTLDITPLVEGAVVDIGDKVLHAGLVRLRTLAINRLNQKIISLLKLSHSGILGGSPLKLVGYVGIDKVLYKIPIIAPISIILTIASIVELSKELQVMPVNSLRRPHVVIQVILQSAALTLTLASPLLGPAAVPVWISFMAVSFLATAESIRQTERLNVSMLKALGLSLGFHSSELSEIQLRRELVRINLALADEFSKASDPNNPYYYKWVVVKVPKLTLGGWKNISIIHVPKDIISEIEKKARTSPQMLYEWTNHEYLNYEASICIDIKESRYKRRCMKSEKGVSRYWQRQEYFAAPVEILVNFSSASGIWEQSNTFVPDHSPPLANYTLEKTLAVDRGVNWTLSKLNPIFFGRNNTRPSLLIVSKATLEHSPFSSLQFNQPLITTPDYAALYADARAFSNSTFQKTLFFFFDPREGDATLEISSDGLKLWDQLHQRHNDKYSNSTTQSARDYLIVVKIDHKDYPEEIIFPFYGTSQLTVADRLHRISSCYFIETNHSIPFIVVDEAASVDITFLDNHMFGSTIKTNFLSPDIFEIIIETPTQRPDYITLVGNKTQLGLTILGNHSISQLKLAAQHVEVLNARGEKNKSGFLELDCCVKSFSVVIRGDLIVKSCKDTYFLLRDNRTVPGVIYKKNFESSKLSLYQLQLSTEATELTSLLKTLTRNRDSFNVSTTFSVMESHVSWIVPRHGGGMKELTVIGQLHKKNAVLTLQAEQSIVVVYTGIFQPAVKLVEHDTYQATLSAVLRVQSVSQNTSDAWFSPSNQENEEILQGLDLLETFPSQGRGMVLIFQASVGYPEIHRFPNSSRYIAINGIHYQLKTDGVLYVVDAENGRITGEQLLRYNDPAARPMGISFSKFFHESQIEVDRDTLLINHLQLDRLPGETLLYFGPTEQQQEIVPLRALQNSIEEPELVIRRVRHIPSDAPITSSAQLLTPWATQLFKEARRVLSSWNSGLSYYASHLSFSGWSAAFSKPVIHPTAHLHASTLRGGVTEEQPQFSQHKSGEVGYMLGHFQGSLQLLDLVIRKWTGRKYAQQPVIVDPPQEKEIETQVANFVEVFSEEISEAIAICETSTKSEVDFHDLFQRICRDLRHGQAHLVEKRLHRVIAQIFQATPGNFQYGDQHDVVNIGLLQQQWVSFPIYFNKALSSLKYLQTFSTGMLQWWGAGRARGSSMAP